MTGTTYVQLRRGDIVEVANHARTTIAHHEPTVRALAALGLGDAQIGARLDPPLTTNQVCGIRHRADPPIPAGRRCGRPRRRPDTTGEHTP